MRNFYFPLFDLGMVVKAPRVVRGLRVSKRVALLAAEAMCLGLRKWRQPKMRLGLRGSKACLVSDGDAVLHGRMFGISCRCILEMLDGETESTLGGIFKGAGLGWLKGGVDDEAGLGYFVGGLVGIRMSTLSRDKVFLTSQALGGRGSA